MPIVATAIVASGLTGVGVWIARRSIPPQVARFTLTLPEGHRFTNPGRHIIAVSPDGTRIAYVANQQLYLRVISELEAKPVPGTADERGVVNPAFSPDGRSLVFWSSADQTIKTIDVSGSTPVIICPTVRPYGMRWDRRGILVGQGSRGILRVSPASGGKPEIIVSVKPGELAFGPELLPDGDTLLFSLATWTTEETWDKAQVVAQSLKTGDRRVIVDGGSDARYLPTGHLVYALRGMLFAVPFDHQRLTLTGERVAIVDGVRRSDGSQTGAAQFSVSDTGSLAYVPGPSSGASYRLAFSDRRGVVEQLKLPAGTYRALRVSPNGQRVALAVEDAKGGNIWIHDLSKTDGSIRQLTFGGRNRFPVWAPDGQRVAFQSDREGDPAIFWQRADGTDTAKRLTKPAQGQSHMPESWSRTGDRLLFSTLTGSGYSLWSLSVPGGKSERFGEVISAFPMAAMFSPDGRWVTYSQYSTATSSTGIFVEPVPRTGAQYRIAPIGLHPLWSADGKALYYLSGTLYMVPVTTGRGFEFGSALAIPTPFVNPGPTVPRVYDGMPDGGRLLGLVAAEPGQSGQLNQIHVVLNWFEELKQKVPPTK
jgi:Tol biopolymer transport system component